MFRSAQQKGLKTSLLSVSMLINGDECRENIVLPNTKIQYKILLWFGDRLIQCIWEQKITSKIFCY